MTRDEQWMARCLELAHQAGAQGEVPVGALIVAADGVVAEGVESSRGLLDPSAHAEVYALLTDSTLSGTPPPTVIAGVLHAECAALMRAYATPRT